MYAGGADDHKNLNKLFLAFGLMPSSLRNEYCLVMAGKDVKVQEPYLRLLASELGIEDAQLSFTGFVTDHQLVSLYKNCAVFVYPSYSEGFGFPVLEAMASGAPVLAANAASIPEILDYQEALFDPFNEIELASKIEKSLTNPRFKLKLIEEGKKSADKFSWRASAKRLYEVFDKRLRKPYSGANFDFGYQSLISDIVRYPGDPSCVDLKNIAKSISENFIKQSSPKTCYIDLSNLVHFDHATGIQRVVRAIAAELFKNKDYKIKFLPIYSFSGHNNFYYANQENGQFPPISKNNFKDNIVDFNDGDVILFLDLHPGSAISKKIELQNLRNRSVNVYFVVYDLIPISHPQYFVEELSDEFKKWLEIVINSDGAVCISEDVANKLCLWISQNSLRPSANFKIKHFQLGADITNSVPSGGLPTDAEKNIAIIKNNKSFLMVGTVEPRKGHAFVLDAFESLWSHGEDYVLVIVGREGWRNEETIRRLRSSPENSNRLFWLEGISDEYLEKIYGVCTCLIAASESEGFGLPLIEAAQHKLPIIARDIPIFREVAGEYAYFFNGFSYESLVICIKNWVVLYESDQVPQSVNIPYVSWEKSAEQLLSAINVYPDIGGFKFEAQRA